MISEVSLQALIDSARALHQKPRDKRLPDPTLLAAIERRLLIAVRRDRTGSTDRDGYPAGSLGGGRGNGQTIIVKDENGNDDRVPVTSVEASAMAKPERDRHHELTLVAVRQLEQIVLSANMVISALNSIDDLTEDRGPAPRTCQACTGHRPLGGDQPVAHRGTVGNRLERDTDLCEFCYSYVCQSAPAQSRGGRLPEPADITYHDQRGRWRLRIAG